MWLVGTIYLSKSSCPDNQITRAGSGFRCILVMIGNHAFVLRRALMGLYK